MVLKESGEMYLETILILYRKNPFVRSVDISEYMGYSKPSVSRGMGILKAAGYIVIDKDGHITLTPSGMEIAQKILDRHTVLSQMLMMLGVDREVATADACRIEHVISDESFASIKNHMLKYGGYNKTNSKEAIE